MDETTLDMRVDIFSTAYRKLFSNRHLEVVLGEEEDDRSLVAMGERGWHSMVDVVVGTWQKRVFFTL